MVARATENASLVEVARAIGVHPVHLARVFRQFYHTSPGDFVRRLRLDAAMRAICGSERPLSEIALEAGYYDQSHFTRVFKHHTGMSPARFRRICRPL